MLANMRDRAKIAENQLAAVTEQRDVALEDLAELRASVLDLSHPNIKMILSELDEAREQANDMREKWLAKGQCCEYLGAERCCYLEVPI